MSQQFTLQIENFTREQNLIIDINSFHFSQFSHLPATSVGSVGTTEIVISRSSDKYSPLFIIALQADQSFPKAVVQVNSSGGGKSYLFTFRKVSVHSHAFYNDDLEEINLVFGEMSHEEISPVGNAAKPSKPKKTKKK